jgi:flavin-dependent dehydrogenase
MDRNGAVDVVVVGGRIAGSLTAARLALRGVRVRLLEARAFPSDTLSTHFFRGDGLVRSLAEVGVLDEVLATGAPPLGCEYFSVDGAPYAQGPPQDPGSVGYCLSVRRSTLDDILVRRASEVGADVRTHTRVVDVVAEDGACRGVVDERGEVHLADVVVGADGRRSSIARLVDAADEERHAPARAMYFRYATGWEPPHAGAEDGPEVLLDGPDFAYAFPSDAGVTCLAVSVPLASHRDGAGPAATLERVLGANPRTVDRIPLLAWTGRVLTGLPADSVWRRAAGPGWALVGDAATAQDPWAGLGMDTAARQAEAFVEAFCEQPGDWQATYDALRRERTFPAYAQTTELAPDLRRLVP